MRCGYPNLMGPAQVGRSVAPITDWYSLYDPSKGVFVRIPARPGFKVARVTCIGRGQNSSRTTNQVTNNLDPSTPAYQHFQQSGAGGNCAASIISLKSSDVFVGQFNAQTTEFSNESQLLVCAGHADLPTSINKGDLVTFGGKSKSQSLGISYEPEFPEAAHLLGGGAGGTFGNAVNEIAGPCFTWTRTSDRAFATAGSHSQDFGGGAATNKLAGLPLIVVEWGISSPF